MAFKIEIREGLFRRVFRPLTPQEEATPGLKSHVITRGGVDMGNLIEVSRAINFGFILDILHHFNFLHRQKPQLPKN